MVFVTLDELHFCPDSRRDASTNSGPGYVLARSEPAEFTLSAEPQRFAHATVLSTGAQVTSEIALLCLPSHSNSPVALVRGRCNSSRGILKIPLEELHPCAADVAKARPCISVVVRERARCNSSRGIFKISLEELHLPSHEGIAPSHPRGNCSP